MVHLAYEAQLDERFGLFGDSANLDTRLVHGLRQTYHTLEIVFDPPDGTTR
jgi:hypothetical protein